MTTFRFEDIGYRYRGGAVRYHDLAYVLCIDPGLKEDGLPHTAFYAWDEGLWGMYEIGRWDAHSVCVPHHPKIQGVALGQHGRIRVMGNQDDYDEDIAVPGVTLSTLREIRNVGGYAYVCGMDRQVFKRLAPGEWVALHGDMPTQPAPDVVFGFESIHGLTETDVHAVGWHGEIWHFDGERWQACQSPVKDVLTRVLHAEDGWAYACGMNGTLLRGRGTQWESLTQAATDADIQDLAWFEGTLYVSTLHALYVLREGDLVPADLGEVVPTSCHRLSAADGLLLSVGADDILSFDGTQWTRVVPHVDTARRDAD